MSLLAFLDIHWDLTSAMGKNLYVSASCNIYTRLLAAYWHKIAAIAWPHHCIVIVPTLKIIMSVPSSLPNTVEIPSTVEKIRSLTECIIHAQSQGFVDEYKILANDHATHDNKATFLPENITLINHYHFSGYSNGLEISTLWLIQDSTEKKGIIINAKSSVSHTRTLKFINRIQERMPKKFQTGLLPRIMQLFFD